jgi:hypothetical protein
MMGRDRRGALPRRAHESQKIHERSTALAFSTLTHLTARVERVL